MPDAFHVDVYLTEQEVLGKCSVDIESLNSV